MIYDLKYYPLLHNHYYIESSQETLYRQYIVLFTYKHYIDSIDLIFIL